MFAVAPSSWCPLTSRVHLAREEEQEQQEAVGGERRQGQLQPRGQIWQSSRVQSSGRQR